jgi:hypothetical protein
MKGTAGGLIGALNTLVAIKHDILSLIGDS